MAGRTGGNHRDPSHGRTVPKLFTNSRAYRMLARRVWRAVRTGSCIALAIDLDDYEKGDKFDGDYDVALAEVQKRLSHLQVAHLVC